MMEWILTSTVLILAVILVRAALGRRMGPKLRYALWLLVLARLLLPFSFGQSAVSPANLARIPEQAAVMTPTVTAPPETTGAPTEPDNTVSVSTAPNTGSTAGQSAANTNNTAGQSAASTGIATEQPAVNTGSSGGTTGSTAATDWKAMLSDLLPKLWVVGMAAAAAWFLFCNLLFYRNLRRSRTLLQTDGKLRIYEADAPSPCLFGLFRPAVYVTPEAAADDWMLEHTLLHEKTHLRHGDHIWAFLRTVCLILWWYHPLVWVAARLSRQDSELYCDAAVIEALGEEHRAEYGRTLLALSIRGKASAFCAASTLSRGGRQMKGRIAAIARWAKPKKWAIVLALLLAAIAVGCAFTGAAQPTEAPADTEESADTPTEDPVPETGRTPGPLTDADLSGRASIHLGMSFEQVDAILSFTDDEFIGAATGMQTYFQDSTLYTFYRDQWGWKYWLSGFSTQTDPDFLGLGVGVGSSLADVIRLLGCDPADDPGPDQNWLLYGMEEAPESACVYASGTGEGRFLSAWTEHCTVQFQFDSNDTVVQIVASAPAVDRFPFTDEDLRTIRAIEPGMSYTTVTTLLGASATVTEESHQTLVEQDGLTFLFRDVGEGMQLMQYSSDVPGTELPLGLTVGETIDEFLRDNLGLAELPSLPLEEPYFFYGSEETSISALLSPFEYEDTVGHLEIYTEHFLFRCSLDKDRTILHASCYEIDQSSARSWFLTDPAFQDCTMLDALDFGDAGGNYSGAVIYTEPGEEMLRVAYLVMGYRPHFSTTDFSRIGSDLEYQAGSLRHISGDRIAVSLKHRNTGETNQWQITPMEAQDGVITLWDSTILDGEDSVATTSDAVASEPVEESNPTTREEFLNRLANDEYFRKTEVLACVMFDDPVSGVDGVALCRRPDTGSLWVAYSTPGTDRGVYPMGIGNLGELDYVDNTFSYADGTTRLTVYNRVIGQKLEHTLTHTVSPQGSLTFSSQTSPLIPDRYASFRSGQVLDWIELPDSAEADAALVISADGSGANPQICYCYDLYDPEPRFIYSAPADGMEYQSGSLYHVSGDQTAVTLKDTETARVDEWQVSPIVGSNGPQQLEMQRS